LQIIPAIDIKNGCCVRLEQGDFSRSTQYGNDPLVMAKHWEELGAQRLHIVDLDGAAQGRQVNGAVITDIINALKIPIQVGGGIRSIAAADTYLSAGAAAVILGTAALKDPTFVRAACSLFGKRIIIGVDALAGMVALEGWLEKSQVRALDFALLLRDLGVGAAVYTDISRDGMQRGINVEATREFAISAQIPVIASGGLANLEEIDALLACEADGIIGVIVGRALYNKSISLPSALARAAGQIFANENILRERES